jgi:hypothetical protein
MVLFAGAFFLNCDKFPINYSQLPNSVAPVIFTAYVVAMAASVILSGFQYFKLFGSGRRGEREVIAQSRVFALIIGLFLYLLVVHLVSSSYCN